MYKAVFTINDPNYVYIGYTNGDDWNGFATPFFELTEAMEVMHEYNIDAADSQIFMHYDKSHDRFFRIVDGEAEVWEGTDYNTPDGIKHLYGIGTYYWVWEEITDYNVECIARRIEEFIWEFDTYEHRDQYDDREELVNSIIAQLKDFSTLKQSVRIFYNDDLTEESKFEKLGGILKL